MYLIINNNFIDIEPLKYICLVWILSSSMMFPRSLCVCVTCFSMYSFYYQWPPNFCLSPLLTPVIQLLIYFEYVYVFVDIWFTYFCIQLGFELLPYRYRHHVVQSPTLKRSPLVFATETLKIAPNCWVPMDLYVVLGINLYGLQMSGTLYSSLELLQTCFPVYWMNVCLPLESAPLLS